MANIGRLVDGFKRFSQRYFIEDRHLYERLSKGQSPKIMMIACSDSRVDPAILTDCGPGELFTVRNVANLVPPCEADGHHHGTSAALEFGVQGLEVEHIIVMGHSKCAGIKALMDHGAFCKKGEPLNFVTPWVEIAAAARKQVFEEHAESSPETQLSACEQAAILVSLENLLSFPAIRKRVIKGTLKLHGWYFDLEHGQMLAYNPETLTFESLEP